MKVLVFGPSGSGKTYVARALKKAGLPAFDTDEIDDLNHWYTRDGQEVPAPKTANEALNSGYSFLWSRKALAKFLAANPTAYLFGGSGNLFDVIHLFNAVYFLKIDPELQRQRLLDGTREHPEMDRDINGLVIWGEWFEAEAKKRGIPMIDANATPMDIYNKII